MYIGRYIPKLCVNIVTCFVLIFCKLNKLLLYNKANYIINRCNDVTKPVELRTKLFMQMFAMNKVALVK